MKKFEAQDPDFERRVRASFAKQQAMALMEAVVAPARAGEGQLLTAKRRVLKPRRKVSVCAGDMFSDDGTLVATMLATKMVVDRPGRLTGANGAREEQAVSATDPLTTERVDRR